MQLSSVEDEGLGEELSVVWELEPGAVCLEKAQLPQLKAFDLPRTFDAFLDAVAWGSVSSTDDKADYNRDIKRVERDAERALFFLNHH